MEEENDPEIQARIQPLIDKVIDDARSIEEKFDDHLLRLIGNTEPLSLVCGSVLGFFCNFSFW